MAPDEGEARRLWAELERMPTPQRARSAICWGAFDDLV